jgi:hypothetical protein
MNAFTNNPLFFPVRIGPGPVMICVALVAGACTTAQAEPIGVVELFTSQGCSSCPPADRTMAAIAADPDMVALTFSVDYWDYLGWKDTFARPEFTARQRGYAAARSDNSIYTPQAILNGRADILGSDESRIRTELNAMSKAGKGLIVPIEAEISGDRVIVKVPAQSIGETVHAAVWIAAYRRPTTVMIERGENGGQEMTYTNIVERWQVLGMWDGKAMDVELPLADIAGDTTAGLAVILQTKAHNQPGPILGAAKVSLAAD